jgi:hypothetical protein
MDDGEGGRPRKRPRVEGAKRAGHKRAISECDDARPTENKSRKAPKTSKTKNTAVFMSSLAAWLLVMFASGSFSPQRVQHIAALALGDVAQLSSALMGCGDKEVSFPQLAAFAKLGSSGRWPNHMSRDLFNIIDFGGMPPTFKTIIPFIEPFGSQRQEMMLPHVIFAALYDSYPGAFKRSIASSGERLAMFWHSQANNPQLLEHPLKHRRGFEQLAVPLGFHGDGVPATGRGKAWVKLMDNWSWTSLVGTGKTNTKLFFVWGVMQKICIPSVTLDAFFKVMKWSFTSLWTGKWPDRDWTGEYYSPESVEGQRANKELAGGYYGVLWGIMGDLDYFAKDLGLPHYDHLFPCALCPGGAHGPIRWNDFRANAAWIARTWSGPSWRDWVGRSKCPLFDIPGVTCRTVALDYMHCKYLGSDQYLFGSVLYVLCFFVMAASPEENMAVIWNFIKQFYKANKTKVRYHYLNRISMFQKKKGFPKLRGKAAEIRSLGPALHQLWKTHMVEALGIHRHIEMMLRMNVAMEDLLLEFKGEDKFPTTAAKRFRGCAFYMAQLQNKVAAHYWALHYQLFTVTSKTHFVMHIAILAEHINPRLLWCFSGEDMMGKQRLMCDDCVKGNTMHAAGSKLTQHNRLNLHLALSDINVDEVD